MHIHMSQVKKTHAIVCIGGWKYIGELVDVNVSLLGLGKLQWVKIRTQNSEMLINADHIVSIIEYGSRKTSTNRKTT